MKEKIKIMLSLVIFLFLFPYIVTVFFQGTPVAGESVYETATETAVMAQGSMPKEREQLIAILAKEIHVDSEREAIRAQAVIARANYDYAVAAGREPESGLSVQEMMAAFGEKNFATDYQILADAVDDTADITVSYGGNTTLMIGVDKEKVEETLDIIKSKSSTRKEFMVIPSTLPGYADSSPTPVQVTLGGATVFIVDVEQFYRF